jgi:hypothetical protein
VTITAAVFFHFKVVVEFIDLAHAPKRNVEKKIEKAVPSIHAAAAAQGCQIFPLYNVPKRGKNITNNNKLSQMTTKYTKWL